MDEVTKMTFQDWISYVIERFLRYVETPKEERRKQRQVERWSSKWFGLLPFSAKMMWTQWKSRFPNRK